MPFIVIKGTFHVVGYQPDGDSIRFQADNIDLWKKLSGRKVDLSRKRAQLRIEAVDTLETHYSGFHQPVTYGRRATRFLLWKLGIRKVKYTKSGLKVTSARDGTRGYIIAAMAEGNGRPVSFAYAGNCAEADGATVKLEAARLDRSVNCKLARAGLAYPTYYSSLADDLREKFTAAVKAARTARAGCWPKDRTAVGLRYSSLWWLETRQVMLPKLFRRLVGKLGKTNNVAKLQAYLASNSDRVKNLNTGKWTYLSRLIELQGNTLRLTVDPTQLVFRETA